MVIHACVFSQALFSTELHWRTKLYASAITSEHLSCSLLTSAELSLSHTWLYSALTRYDSSSALFDATPACPHTLSGPVLHTYVSDSSTQSPDALFSIVLKPPAGVFSTTDRRFFDHRPATDRFFTDRQPPTGYRPATDRLPATAGYRPATVGYRPATVGYRLPATAGYRRLRRLRLPPATSDYWPATNRLPPVQKKKKNFFLTPEECHSCSLQTEFPIWRLGDADRAQKFSGHVLQNEDCMCVSLYIYGH